ncbi:delta(14)-sterol reductase-like isoform X2 [Salvia miltiorrhiza]|uniref:delta(14)-sterol reductase-like isoform X2 n=1 Tax=Salvia miltiorrhiza TaxID=226208 RepID=UPI0025AD0F1F|nr:delta(14)-sterol reductase-like isoform X2 [Salvia miltiorrhiza]XP_057812118.1 delta(14)-sterol reductase-like isoform X2 [Salvia miltiorrhiza]
MDLSLLLLAFTPSWTSVAMLLGYVTYLAIVGSILPGKVVPGVTLSDGTRLHYRCNGLLLLFLLVFLLGIGGWMDLLSPTVTNLLYMVGCRSRDQSSSFKPHTTGNLIEDWWFGIQLNPQFMGLDLKFYFVRAGMLGWLLINLSVLVKCIQESNLSQSMILYQLFCVIYIMDYFVHEEYMTSTWDIIAERLGFMLVFGDIVWIPFTFSIQGWWLLRNKVEMTTAAIIANCLVFFMGYLVFRGANKQKHVFKKNPKALIWGRPPKVIGGKLLASGYWGIARHSNYLGDLLVALSFSLPCGMSSPVPYFYPTYLFILLIWRERRDETRCTQKYKDIWAEYKKAVPWRILPYVY